MSLRRRSTIIRFSARFFTSRASPSRSPASRSGSGSRGAVPFIGRASMPPAPSSAKKSSGERDSSVAPGSFTSAPCPTGWRAASAAWSAAGSPRQRPQQRQRQVRLVDVAGADVVGDAPEGVPVRREVPCRPEARRANRLDAAGAAGSGAPNTPNSSSGSRRRAGMQRRQPPLERIAELVRRIARDPGAARQRRVERRQRRRHLAEPARRHHRLRPREARRPVRPAGPPR